jgi:hypothetical protein
MSGRPRVPVVEVVLANILVRFESIFARGGFLEVFTLSQNFESVLEAPRPDQVDPYEALSDPFAGVF